MGRKLKRNTYYGIWDTERECLDSVIQYESLEEAQEACDDRNRQLQGVEFLEDGYVEYTDEMPTVYEVRKIVAEVPNE